MHVICCQTRDELRIGDDVRVQVLELADDWVRLGITAAFQNPAYQERIVYLGDDLGFDSDFGNDGWSGDRGWSDDEGLADDEGGSDDDAAQAAARRWRSEDDRTPSTRASVGV